MSDQNAFFEGEICLRRSDSTEENSTSESDCPEDDKISSSSRRYRFLLTLCSAFAEQIDVGTAKGWVRYFKERDLSDEFSSAVEDGWLKLSVKITLVSDEAFGNALPRILKRLPTHHLPKIDSGTEVRRQGVNRLLRAKSLWITSWQMGLVRLKESNIATG